MIDAMASEMVVPARELGKRAVMVGVAVDLTLAVLGGMIHELADPLERSASGVWGSVAFAAVVAAPGLLALLGLQGRPWLLTAAGVLLLPMCFLSFSFLFFPLLVPAVIFLTVAIVRPRGRPRPWAQCAAAVLSALFVVGAIVSLFAHEDPAERNTPTSSAFVSDVITMQEALTSLGFFVAAIAVAVLAPRDGNATRR
jgi:hypothetical protein